MKLFSNFPPWTIWIYTSRGRYYDHKTVDKTDAFVFTNKVIATDVVPKKSCVAFNDVRETNVITSRCLSCTFATPANIFFNTLNFSKISSARSFFYCFGFIIKVWTNCFAQNASEKGIKKLYRNNELLPSSVSLKSSCTLSFFGFNRPLRLHVPSRNRNSSSIPPYLSLTFFRSTSQMFSTSFFYYIFPPHTSWPYQKSVPRSGSRFSTACWSEFSITSETVVSQLFCPLSVSAIRHRTSRNIFRSSINRSFSSALLSGRVKDPYTIHWPDQGSLQLFFHYPPEFSRLHHLQHRNYHLNGCTRRKFSFSNNHTYFVFFSRWSVAVPSELYYWICWTTASHKPEILPSVLHLHLRMLIEVV